MNSSDKNLKIAFDAKRLFYNHTGLGNYSRTLVKNLQKYFPENEYHLFTPGIKENSETDFFINSGKFIIHTPQHSNILYRTWLMSADVNRLKPHIFHGLSHEIPFGLDKTIRTVVTFHDLIYEKYPHQFGIWDRYLYKWKYKSSAFRSDRILAISQSTKNDLEQLYRLDSTKIHVIYQSCHEDFQMPGHPLVSDFPKSIKDLSGYFLYVGSIIERKGLLDCVKAYSLLPTEYRRPFVVVGSGKGRYMASVTEEIKKYNLQDDFIFLNNISNSELVRIYDRCWVFLYPSIYEGFGIPVIESLFRKRPVITIMASSLPEAAGEGGILVPGHNPEAIAEAVISYLTNEELYNDKVNKGFRHVSEKFSSKKTADQLMHWYKSII